LFVPGVVSTFLVMGFVAAGWYEKGRAYENEVDMPGFHEPQPPMVYGEGFGTQFAVWAGWTWRWLNVWTPQNHAYDVHLWTLPVEFRSSMILFMALVGFARTRPRIRLGMLGMCIVYCHYTNAWEGWLFFAGSFLAQLKMLQEEAESTPLSLDLTDASDEKVLGAAEPQTSSMDHARILLFVAGLYLLSSPDLMLFPSEDPENPDAPPGPVLCAPGYCLLSTLSPQSWPEPFRFPHCLGAFVVVYATSSTRTSTLRSLFDNPLSVYLGKISFALYLVHGPVVHMLGFCLVPLCWRWSGKDTLMQKEVGFGIAFVIVTAVVVWVADVFWRGVDQKCVAFARWCEGFVLVKER
jgi:peptidoglycan/LPS O-acetylase OafA/YrhL